jgi:hypothetical protein
MSVLHSRIMAHDAGAGPGAGNHPYGTAETPMVMPLATVDYAGEQAVYGTAHPLVTADGAVIAARSHRAATIPHVGVTVPAGRP